MRTGCAQGPGARVAAAAGPDQAAPVRSGPASPGTAAERHSGASYRSPPVWCGTARLVLLTANNVTSL